jgi:2,4-dienoyl-CoA reductase-like NADH-dependent reductase (Old Yellow Enzyme family)
MTITKLARQLTDVPVIANGGMHEISLAEMVLSCGHADMVSLGRGALANPDWPNRLRDGRLFSAFEHGMIQPKATIENTIMETPRPARTKARTVVISGTS